MTEEMRNTISEVLEETLEPISGLSVADLCVVKGIRFNAISEKFLIYLDMQRMTLITSTFFFVVGKIQLEEILTEALKKTFPFYETRYFYIGEQGSEYKLRVSR